MDAYFSHQKLITIHPASPMVNFIVSLFKVNPATCQAVLQSGFLDVLLCLYASNFTSNIPSFGDMTVGRKALIEDISDGLVILCRKSDARAFLSAHPICALWPMNQPLRSILGDQTAERQTVWRQLGPAIATRRISSLSKTVHATDILYPDELEDNIVDITEFSR
jgi:hypothetical protein